MWKRRGLVERDSCRDDDLVEVICQNFVYARRFAFEVPKEMLDCYLQKRSDPLRQNRLITTPLYAVLGRRKHGLQIMQCSLLESLVVHCST